MFQTLLTITPLFLIIFGSALFATFGVIKERWSQVLNAFALNVGLPALVIAVLAKHPLSFAEELPTIILNSAYIIGCFLIVFIISLLFRFKKDLRRTLFICSSFGNIAFLGIPILGSVYGVSVLPTASLIVAIYLFWMFTIGTGYLELTQHQNKRHALRQTVLHLVKNPLLISAIIGMVIGNAHIPLPRVVLQSIDMLAASVTPIVLVVIGIFIGSSSFGRLRDWVPVGMFTIGTLLLLPGLLFLILPLFGQSPAHYSASIIDAAMPLAITPFALADQYHLNKQFIARTVVLSTVLSVISIPFWVSVL